MKWKNNDDWAPNAPKKRSLVITMVIDAFKANWCSTPTPQATKASICIFPVWALNLPNKKSILFAFWTLRLCQLQAETPQTAQPMHHGTPRTCGTFPTASTQPLSLLCLLLSQNPAGIPSMLQLEPRWRACWLAETKHTSVCVCAHANTHAATKLRRSAAVAVCSLNKRAPFQCTERRDKAHSSDDGVDL